MSYAALFNLSLTHTYYTDDVCSGLALQPTTGTQKLMSNLGLLLRYGNNKYSMLTEVNGDGSFFYFTTKPFCLSFYLTQLDPRFNNFTDLPFFANKKICAFNNIDVSYTSAGVLLQESAFVNAWDVIDRVTLQCGIPVAATGVVSVKNSAGDVVAQATVQNGIFPFVAPNGQEGIYSLEQNNVVLQRICALSAPGNLAITGFAELWFSPAVPLAAQFLSQNGNITVQEYFIAFAARKTFWKYLIVSDAYLSNMKNIAVTDKAVDVFFTKESPEQLFNGQKALAFVSPEPYGLSDAPEQVFQLRKNCIKGGNKGTVVVNKLPIAEAENIVPVQNDQQVQNYSDIIVYL